MRFFEELKIAANDVNLELSEKQYEQFIKYMRLVQEWNEKINLTAITEERRVCCRWTRCTIRKQA